MNNHQDRPVAMAVDSDGRAVITKRYHEADGAAIYASHQALWQSAFGRSRSPQAIPEPLSWDVTTSTVTMELAPGEPIGARGDLGSTTQHTATVARLLADFHASGVVVDRRRSASGLVRAVDRKAVEMAASPLGKLYEYVCWRARCAKPTNELSVINHGDFSPRNVLFGDGRLSLIDFDRLQMASPARDIAYWGAWAWATHRLNDQHPSWDLGDALLEEYLRCSPLPGVQRIVDEINFHRSVSLLRIVHGWSALRSRVDIAGILLGDASAVLMRPVPVAV